MQRILFALFATAMALPFAGDAQERADFSGIWKMDASRSESAHQAVPIGPVTVVIQQTKGFLRVETKRREADAEKISTEILTFRLDGKESTSTGAGGEPVQVKAHWDGGKLVTESERNIQGSTITTLQILSLDGAGRELTIDKTLNVQHGYQFEGSKATGRGKDVFVRANAAERKAAERKAAERK